MNPSDNFASPSTKSPFASNPDNPFQSSYDNMAVDQSPVTGTLKERLLKKAWKIKSDALDELLALITNSTQGEEVYEYSPMFAALLTESHPTALEKAIDCIEAYLKNQALEKLENPLSLFKTLIQKGFAASKPALQQKSLGVILILLRNYSSVIQVATPVVECMGSRVIKIQIAAINLARELIAQMGIQNIPFKPLLKPIESLASHQNLLIRSAVYLFYQECYCWLGDSLRPFLASLKPAQLAELDKKFANAKPKSLRSPRSSKKGTPKSSSSKPYRPKPSIDLDPYELAEQVNPWSRFNGGWMERVLKIQKWEQKQQELDQLIKACDVIKIQPAGIQGVLPGLLSMAGSNNANIVTSSIQTICNIAKGTRNHFKPYAKGLLSLLMLKYKERKPSLLKAATEALQALGKCYKNHLGELLDQFVSLIGDKNPTVKIHSLHWIKVNTIASTSLKDIKQVEAGIGKELKKVVSDGVAEVRDAALELVGTLRGRLGPESLNGLFVELNPPKKKKVNDAMQEVQKQFGNASEKKQKKAEVSPFKISPSGCKMMKKPNRQEVKEHPKPMRMPHHEPGESKVIRKAPLGGGCQDIKGVLMTKQDAEEVMLRSINPQYLQGLESGMWKDKLGSIQNLTTWSEEQNDLDEEVIQALLVHLKGKLRDFKESNVMIGKAWITLVTLLAKRDALRRRLCSLFFSPLFQKYADSKFKATVQECVFRIAQSLGPGFISKLVVNCSKEAKNPNIIKEGCGILIQIPQEFGSVHGLPIKEIIDCAKIAIAHNNVAVRKSASDLLVSYYRWLGVKSRGLIISDIKQSSLKSLENQLDKAVPFVEGQFPPKRELQGEAAQLEEQQKNKRKGGPEALIDSMIPRKDITVTRKVIRDCSDPNGKVRLEALDKIQAIIHEAGDRIQLTGTSQLIGVLSARLKEESSNKIAIKNLAMTVGLIGSALGKFAIKIKSKFFPQILDILTNKAPDVRQAVVSALDQWASSLGPETLFNYVPQRLKHQSPELKIELLEWTAEQIKRKQGEFNYDFVSLVKPLLSCLNSKDVKVRASAQHLLAELGPMVGRAPFQSELKQASNVQLRNLIQKYAPAHSVNRSQPTLKRVESEKTLPAFHKPLPQITEVRQNQLLSTDPKPGSKMIKSDTEQEFKQSSMDSSSIKLRFQNDFSRIGKGFGLRRPQTPMKCAKVVEKRKQEEEQDQSNSMDVEVVSSLHASRVKMRSSPRKIEQEKESVSWKQEFLDRQFDEVIDKLKYGQAKQKVEGLESLCGWLNSSEDQKFMEGNKVNEIIDGVLSILNYDLQGYEQTVPFIFQFLNVLHQLVKREEAIKRIKIHRLYRLMEQLIIATLFFTQQFGPLHQMKQNEELSQSESDWGPHQQLESQRLETELRKRFKSVLMKVMSNSNPTDFLTVLLRLLSKYSINGMGAEFVSLLGKATISFSNMLQKHKRNLILPKVMLALHEYLNAAQQDSSLENFKEFADQVFGHMVKRLRELYDLEEIERSLTHLIKEQARSMLLLQVGLQDQEIPNVRKLEGKEIRKQFEDRRGGSCCQRRRDKAQSLKQQILLNQRETIDDVEEEFVHLKQINFVQIQIESSYSSASSSLLLLDALNIAMARSFSFPLVLDGRGSQKDRLSFSFQVQLIFRLFRDAELYFKERVLNI